MRPPLRRYRRDFDHSYAFGVFPTLELLLGRPQCVRQVLLYDPGKGRQGLDGLLASCRRHGIVARVCPHAIRRIAGRPFAAVGVFDKYDAPLDPRASHLVLHRPQQEGNLGTIIRTMVGFGLRDLVLIGPSPDVMAPEVIRSSMGAVFHLRHARLGSLDDYHRTAPDHHLACFMTDGAVPLEQLTLRPPFSLIFGSEGAGLPADVRCLGTTVCIRHGPTIDSLNLGVAVGIALHATAAAVSGGAPL